MGTFDRSLRPVDKADGEPAQRTMSVLSSSDHTPGLDDPAGEWLLFALTSRLKST